MSLPPVRYNGELRVNSRAVAPDEGEQFYLLGTTARINMDSFVWQPWFASIGGGLNVSRVQTFAESDSESLLLGGDARLTLFPASEFPTFGFVSVSDTRTDVEAAQIPERQVRITRFGFGHSYQPRDGGGNLGLRADRSIEEGTDDRLRAVIDRLDLSGTLLMERQRLSGTLNVKNIDQELDDENRFELVSTLRHNATPSDTVTVDSFASYTDIGTDSTRLNSRTRNLRANSLAVWRPRRIPLTMSGTANVTFTQQESDGTNSESTATNLALGGDYLINRLTRLTGNVSVNITDENTTSNQGATLSFNPDPFGLGSFTYNWFTSASLSNEIGNPSGDRTILGALFAQGLTRARPFAIAPAWNLSLAANNTVSGSLDSINGAAATLGLNGSVGVAHARVGGFTSVHLDASDTRTYGSSRAFATGDNNFQSINFNLTHRQDLSTSSQWNAFVSMGWNRQDLGGEATITEFSNMNLSYSNSRLFGVPRMLFLSQFSARTIDLFFTGLAGEENTDMRWENRVDYTIGKLETRLTGTWSRVNARNGYTVLLTISRKFDGTF